MKVKVFFSLTFHTEKLHDNRVWIQIKGISRWAEKHGMKLTFFVYPFRAQVAEEDISERVQMLANMGHEIGQHTHFYSGRKIEKPEKVNDLSLCNISHCLRRDFETLRQIGVTPKGFTAGAWIVNETVWDTLIELGFVYDCSCRFPKPDGMTNSPHLRWQRSPQVYKNSRGNLLLLPTTCSLGEWFKWGRKVLTEGSVPYQMVYMHDYDLTSTKNQLMFLLFLAMNRGRRFVNAGTLANLIRS